MASAAPEIEIGEDMVQVGVGCDEGLDRCVEEGAGQKGDGVGPAVGGDDEDGWEWSTRSAVVRSDRDEAGGSAGGTVLG